MGGALLVGTLALWAVAREVPSANVLVITSIAAQGSNVVVTANLPPGLEQVALDTRARLEGPWTEAGVLSAPVGGGSLTFSLPKPGAMQFLRLRAKSLAVTPLLTSGEADYVVIPSLANTATTEAVLHFQGTIDGSDKITISHDGALWEHVNWDWPVEKVTVNGVAWNPREKNYLTSVGVTKFLPDNFSLAAVDLEKIETRSIVALERADNALVVYIDDLPNGPGEYDFKVRFFPAKPKPAAPSSLSTKASLKLSATIDGGDCFIITHTEATWVKLAGGRQNPTNIRINDRAWNPAETGGLKNDGATAFLPATVDFSTAKIVSRKGRDLATMWLEDDSLHVRFADNPNGTDDYEIEIAFGQ